jgi:SAM-dependent methyltransferase
VPPIEVIDDVDFREAKRESLNRLCNIVDWQAWGPLSTVMNQLADSVTIHRKSWEYAMCIHGLDKLGVVTPASTALAVGAGYERPLFYFANCIARMVATDLYDNPGHEGQPAMLTDPERFAPFPYRKEALQVLRMPGDALDFEDDTFDFVFCLSSIEHFGSRAAQTRSLQEMRRVVKPRGVIAIATELILNDATHHEYFTYPELEEMFLRAPGLQLVGGPLDLRIADSLVRYPVMLDSSKNPAIAPHIVLYSHGVLLTSVMLFLSKAE